MKAKASIHESSHFIHSLSTVTPSAKAAFQVAVKALQFLNAIEYIQ